MDNITWSRYHESDIDPQTAMILQLQQQNALLQEQNKMLKELVENTPDRKEVQEGFKEQRRHLEVITRTQKTDYIWGWIKFALIAILVLVLLYGMWRVYSYFNSISQTLGEISERFNATFGGLEEKLGKIQEFYEKLKEFLHIG